MLFAGKDWSSIIPKQDIDRVEEQEKQRVLLELNLPPRQRTTLQQVYKFTSLLLIQSDSISIHIQTNIILT